MQNDSSLRLTRLLCLVVVCGSYAACNREGGERTTPSTTTAHALYDCGSAEGSRLRAPSDTLVTRFIHAINDRDPLTVAQLAAFPDEVPDTASARTGIEGFRHHLQGDVVACEFVPDADSLDGHLEYRLISAQGSSKSVVVYHDDVRSHTRLYDEFLSYYSRAQRYAPAVVEALKARDAQRLATLLSIDDLNYPAAYAEQGIEKYAARFDLVTLQVRYEGLEQERRTDYGPDVNRWFRYRILGTKNGTPAHHEVVISHGDGLLGWRDSLIPDYSGE